MYYILEHHDRNVPAYRLSSSNPKGHGHILWINGKPLQHPPVSALEFELDPDSGVLMPDFFNADMPLFSPRLFNSFLLAGVDNIFSYPAVIANPLTGETIEDYRAINIVGLISASKNNNFESDEPKTPRFLTDLSELSIDPVRCHGLLCFRLLENLPSIVVHEDIVAQLSLDECVALKFKSVDG